MECLDYAEADTEEQLRAQLKRLLESQKMTEQEAECIRIEISGGLWSQIGAENEEGCHEKTSLQRTAFCDSEKCFYAR